ncbi:DNA-binding CsgD family transcriptional regulator [Agromyces ramosus]|uniref:DNA-binding CsgD family transcriptional regulator n=1 Tax=Agromyces ramosus TaxID=33879 RepID=A0A4Q7MIK5_9MICO|nr:helix-turn-helix transcriptional regulator [Agromyces ramosus]RZS67607.1 DNA-binding CsgD family transcriptional regulator [Agromyces ramosus]
MSRPLSSTGGRNPGTVGWEDAAGLVRQMLDGRAPVHAGVTGPGGSGKSTLLDELAVALRSEGMDVVRGLDEYGRADVDPERVALLVDDAEHLGDDDVAALTSLMRTDGPHVVVAFRPWPRSEAVAGLVDRLGRQRPHLVLEHLSTSDVRERAVELLGDPLPDDAVDRVLDLARGNARYVDHVLLAVREDAWDLLETSPLPSSALERLRHRLDRLDPDLLDFLVALAVGFSVSGPALATAPRFADADLRALMAAARATGMVSPEGTLLPIVRITIMQSTPDHELWPMRSELVDAVEAAGVPLGPTALELARHGFRDPRVAEALRGQADEALPTEPVEAWGLYAASIEAGGDVAALAGRRAQAAWAAGDIRAAERLVDGLLTGAEHPDLPRVMNVAAAIWSRKGMLRRGADAYVGLTEAAGCAAAPLAAVCLAVLGEVGQARAILATAPDVEYPTSSQVAISMTADGILAALDGAPDRALSALLQASSVMGESGEALPLPEVPAVLAAHVALNAGELGIAAEVLQSAVDTVQGGPAFRNRLRLTQALVALRADRPARARALLGAVDSSQRPLGLRDEVLAHAVRIGLARRTDDLTTLVRAWDSARQTVARMPIDLTALPALAEFAIAAARLHESHFIEEPLASAWELLERVGRPASWCTNLHWAELQAAILRRDQASLAAHAAALSDAAAANRVASRLAEAGRVWSAALAGEVDVDAVERAVRDLAAAGYPWDAGRLAGHAAGRAAEHRDTLQLLALARGLHPEEQRAEDRREPVDEPSNRARDDGGLSAREREVARLVLEGKTYAEIGSAIFISPRTAEHHIARIRRRLGVTTRSELLARLRLVLDEDE